MCAYQFAAAILLTIPSVTAGQTFDLNAPRETRFSMSVRFGAALQAPTASPQKPAVPADLDLRPIQETLRRLRENPGPCGRTQAQVNVDAIAKYGAGDWLSGKARRNWQGLADVVGSVLADFVTPDKTTTPLSSTDRLILTTAGQTSFPVAVSGTGCPPAKKK